MVELFRISKGRGFQMIGAATEKMQDPKPVMSASATECVTHTYRNFEIQKLLQKKQKKHQLHMPSIQRLRAQ